MWRFFNPGGLDRHRLRHALSVTVLHFFLPALAFGLVATAPADRSFIAIPLTAGIVTVLGMILGFAAYKLLPWFRNVDRPAFGVLVLVSAFGNVTYLGLPVINDMFGTTFGYVAVLYDLLATTPILFTFGVFIAARYGSGKTTSLMQSVVRVLKLPPLWAVLAGIAVNITSMPVPRVILDTASHMGKAVIPIMIFTVGLALDFHHVKRLAVAGPALAIKLVASPVLAWWAGARFGLSGETLRAVAVEGAMPVMVLSLIIADEFDLDVPLAAACIAFSTVLLFITMPVMMKLLF